jgi:hypothetical protein
MNHEDYIKQLESSNHILQEKLDKAQNVVDRIHDNPLQESLTLMIDACLKHQKNVLKSARNVVDRIDEIHKLRIFLPRQIGLSTCIVKACEEFFKEVHILDTTKNYTKTNTHKSVTDIPFDVSCIIVDPWSVKYSGSRDWNEIQDKLWRKMDRTRSYLLILAG